MLSTPLTAVGALEEATIAPRMDVVIISASLSLHRPALSGRDLFGRSSRIRRCRNVAAVECSVFCRGGWRRAACVSPRKSLRWAGGVVVRAEAGKGESSGVQKGGTAELSDAQEEKSEVLTESGAAGIDALVEGGKADGTEWGNVKDRFLRTMQRLKETQQTYMKDIEFWGVGTSAIFRVYQNADGQVTRVEINADEILLRSGLEPGMPRLDDSEGRVEADLKLARANVIAREIEQGLREPPAGSTLYEFKKERPWAGTAGGRFIGGLVGVVGQAGDMVLRTPPLVRQTFFGLLFVYLFLVAWGARVLVADELEKDQVDSKEKESDDRMMKMREMKARGKDEEGMEGFISGQTAARVSFEPSVGTSQGSGDAEGLHSFRPFVEGEEFKRKVAQIQEMARQVRLSEKERLESRKGNEQADGGSDGVGDVVEGAVDVHANQSKEVVRNGRLSVSPAMINGKAGGPTNLMSVDIENSDLDDTADLGQTVSEDDLRILADRLYDVYRFGAESWRDSGKRDPITPFAEASYVEGLVHGRVGGQGPSSGSDQTSQESGEHSRPAGTGQPSNGVIYGSLSSEDLGENHDQVGDTNESEPTTSSPKMGMDSKGRNPVSVSRLRAAARASRPKVIISVEEAKARLAAKKASRQDDSSPPKGSIGEEAGRSKRVSRSAAGIDSSQGSGNRIPSTEEEFSDERIQSADGGEETGASDRLSKLESVLDTVLDNMAKTHDRIEALKKAESSEDQSADGSSSGTPDQKDAVGQSQQGKQTADEKEEEEWMRDDVLREIVYKVQANEKAGRQPFEGLDSDAEALFFKGLERKFEREGEVVKKWIEERVENLDYGQGPISVDDPPEKFMARWKDPSHGRSELLEKFTAERSKILEAARKASGVGASSAPVSSLSRPQPLSNVPTVGLSNEDSDAESGLKDVVRGNERTGNQAETAKKAVESSDPLSSSGKGSVVTVSGKPEKDSEENWQHTKKWSQELQRKYDREKNPETKSLMQEIGQDLDRWITEDEIHRAQTLLSQGVEGQKQYAKEAFEKTKEKINKQREMFGQEAMVAKYSEYKPQKEDELWWLDLPFVVCIGIQTDRNGETEEGMYSLDMAPSMQGTEKNSKLPHTIAFQDRTDATQFLYMMRSQSEEAAAAELVPVPPKELYQEAKSEGFRVTVLRKGQLELTPGQAFEEVEQRIMQIGSSVYWDDILRERSIDMNAVVEEGLGFGRPPST